MNPQPTKQPQFSFELFPPKTDAGMEKLQASVHKLAALQPVYFSVTYGAGGSTQERTFDTVDWLRSEGIETAPHLSAIGASREHILGILERYREQGIRRIVALRGDMPSGMGEAGEFAHANDLVTYIREQTGDHFHIEVAAYPEFHPQATDAWTDLKHFTVKVQAGASGAITQYFYNADAYFHFIDDCHKLGVDIPVMPGIMPINNYTQLARFSDACGSEIPRWIRRRMQAYADDVESIRAFGIEVVSELCQRLLDSGAPGLHFYTMNQAGPTMQICQNLGIDGTT